MKANLVNWFIFVLIGDLHTAVKFPQFYITEKHLTEFNGKLILLGWEINSSEFGYWSYITKLGEDKGSYAPFCDPLSPPQTPQTYSNGDKKC